MTAPLQLPGIDQGLLAKLLGGAGPNGPGGAVVEGEISPEAFAAQLQGMLDELDLSPDQLTPELQALLAQLLNGGISLPETAATVGSDGKALPPFVALAQAIIHNQARGTSEKEGPIAPTGSQLIDRTLAGSAGELPALPEGVQVLETGAQKTSGLPLGQEFEALLAQPGLRQLMRPTVEAGAGVLPISIPGGAQGQGLPIPSQNLLSMPVPQPVSDPGWGAAIGERLVWMAKGDHQLAELKISPPNLGPLEIKLTINHDQASVSFVSHHAMVRDALEAAIPRLREMLAEQSLNLVQADVGAGQQHDPGRSAEGHGNGGAHLAGDVGVEGDDAGQPVAGEGGASAIEQRGLGLLDLFA